MKPAIALLLATLLPTASQAVGNLDARIAGSSAAAEALQGPLDGDWVLVGGRGRPVVMLHIADPVSRPSDLQAAWRIPGDDGTIGPVDRFTRRGDRIRIDLTMSQAHLAQIELCLRNGVWRGQLERDGRIQAVRLIRAAASAVARASSE